MSRAVLYVSSAVALGLTVDVASRAYDKMYPDPNGVRSLYRAVPARALSRAWGKVASARIPEVLRTPLFSAYGSMYGVIYSEMERPSLKDYVSFQDFFTRNLKPGARPVDQNCALACPVDARVMSCGPVDTSTMMLPTVKDYKYRLNDFLGGDWSKEMSKDSQLYQIILYLAPGDYHGFHAPGNMVIEERRHFVGMLLPVAPWMLAALPSLFTVNERVALFGKCDNRRMAYVAVGATNVGSIAMKFDPIVTNASSDEIGKTHCRKFEKPVILKRGEEVGFFKMGSTIVMIFEAPKSFVFSVNPGDKVKLGQRLG